jgi:aldose 1-epimerase
MAARIVSFPSKWKMFGPNELDTANLTLKCKQGGGKVQKNAAISMQMMDWPDALNHPEWQRDNHVLWGPDRLMTTFSKFKFSVEDRK